MCEKESYCLFVVHFLIVPNNLFLRYTAEQNIILIITVTNSKNSTIYKDLLLYNIVRFVCYIFEIRMKLLMGKKDTAAVYYFYF